MTISTRLLWMRKRSVEQLQVRALYDNRELALLVEWDDPIENTGALAQLRD